MARLVACIMTLMALGAVISPAYSQPTVVLVRHGEKLDGSRDSVLSPAGEARAQRLAQMLSTAGIAAIYTTEYRRTALLAAPLSKQLSIAPVVVAAADIDSLVKRIASHRADETVLVVGHSNTVPALLQALGHRQDVKISEAEFDSLFVLVPRGSAPPGVIRMKY